MLTSFSLIFSDIVGLLIVYGIYQEYKKSRLTPLLYLIMTFLFLWIFVIFRTFLVFLDIDGVIFLIGSSFGLTGVLFSHLFWESSKTEKYINLATTIASLLYGLSLGTTILCSFKRPYWTIDCYLSIVFQSIFYLYVFFIALRCVNTIRIRSIDPLFRKQYLLLFIGAFISYIGVLFILFLAVLMHIRWEVSFMFIFITGIIIVLAYLIDPMILRFLPESLYELFGLRIYKILIMTADGVPLFSKSFYSHVEIDDTLIANMFVAIQAFSYETLRIKTPINRAIFDLEEVCVYGCGENNIRGVLVTNKLPRALIKSFNNFIKEFYNQFGNSIGEYLSTSLLPKLNELFVKHFAYILKFVEF